MTVSRAWFMTWPAALGTAPAAWLENIDERCRSGSGSFDNLSTGEHARPYLLMSLSLVMHELPHICSVALMCGFASGGVMLLDAILVCEDFRARIMGTAFGAVSFASTLGMALGPLAGGWLYDAFSSYAWLFIRSCGIGVGAMAIACTFRPPRSLLAARPSPVVATEQGYATRRRSASAVRGSPKSTMTIKEDPMGTRSEALATQLEAKVQEAVAVIEPLSDAKWKQVTETEHWTVGVTAHHLASALEPVAGMVTAIASGQSQGHFTRARLDEMNARHAQEHANCTKVETIALLTRGAAVAASVVRSLTDDQLEKSGTVFTDVPPMTAEQVITSGPIAHIDAHLGSIRKTVGH
jgi:Major Facilitator Superfamily/DinB superfamily